MAPGTKAPRRSPNNGAGKAPVYISGAEGLAEALAHWADFVLDRDARPRCPKSFPSSRKAFAGGFALRITAATVYAAELGQFICTGLSDKFGGLEDRIDSIRIALEEALANAVLHGSLELGSCFDNGLEGIMAYSQEMQKRLALPEYGKRPIVVQAMNKPKSGSTFRFATKVPALTCAPSINRILTEAVDAA